MWCFKYRSVKLGIFHSYHRQNADFGIKWCFEYVVAIELSFSWQHLSEMAMYQSGTSAFPYIYMSIIWPTFWQASSSEEEDSSSSSSSSSSKPGAAQQRRERKRKALAKRKAAAEKRKAQKPAPPGLQKGWFFFINSHKRVWTKWQQIDLPWNERGRRTVRHMHQAFAGKLQSSGLPFGPPWKAWTSDWQSVRFSWIRPEREKTVNVSYFCISRSLCHSFPKIKMQNGNIKRVSLHKSGFLQDTAINRLDYFNWQLLETDKPAQEVPWNLEDAVKWIAGALVRGHFT